MSDREVKEQVSLKEIVDALCILNSPYNTAEEYYTYLQAAKTIGNTASLLHLRERKTQLLKEVQTIEKSLQKIAEA